MQVTSCYLPDIRAKDHEQECHLLFSYFLYLLFSCYLSIRVYV
jgi:hypothetical protein